MAAKENGICILRFEKGKYCDGPGLGRRTGSTEKGTQLKAQEREMDVLSRPHIDIIVHSMHYNF